MRSVGKRVPSAARTIGDVPGGGRDPQPPAPGKTRIIAAVHERLVVTYSALDDTAYVLIPPGEDPRTVLRAARLVLCDEVYQELAGHLGVAPNWHARRNLTREKASRQ